MVKNTIMYLKTLELWLVLFNKKIQPKFFEYSIGNPYRQV
jgi:hypothetical protein